MLTTFELSGIDGANPLGFMSALGTLVALHDAGERRARLAWRGGATWTPVIGDVEVADRHAFAGRVARGLRGREATAASLERLERATHRRAEIARSLKKKEKDIKERGLDRAERRSAEEAELAPLRAELECARLAYLEALREATPRPELALGDRVDCSPEEFRELARLLLNDRDDAIHMLAAFGTDARVTDAGTIEPTPFQFLTGSGHQWFLKTARDLIECVTPERVERALFEPWTYNDEKMSMRWDPFEDRRYALTDTDPAQAAARTVWMANLLGYRALSLFPAAPVLGRPGVVGWTDNNGLAFTWPLWDAFVTPDTVRSLLAMRELGAPRPYHTHLRARGIIAVFRSHRIRVPPTGANYKLNFTPARAV